MASEYTTARARKGCAKRLMRPARAMFQGIPTPEFMREWKLSSKQYDFFTHRNHRIRQRTDAKTKRCILRKVNRYGVQALDENDLYFYDLLCVYTGDKMYRYTSYMGQDGYVAHLPN